jgi:formate hydrogenlyase subunit 6/NADH:ubiquinone oxidoreductase subunit I
MIKITDNADCCGCTACASVCSTDAITMQPDDLGFLYPSVNIGKCTDCGLCEKVCAFNTNYSKKDNLEIPLVYAVRHKNMKEIETSRSGAMFIALSDWILENNGLLGENSKKQNKTI